MQLHWPDFYLPPINLNNAPRLCKTNALSHQGLTDTNAWIERADCDPIIEDVSVSTPYFCQRRIALSIPSNQHCLMQSYETVSQAILTKNAVGVAGFSEIVQSLIRPGQPLNPSLTLDPETLANCVLNSFKLNDALLNIDNPDEREVIGVRLCRALKLKQLDDTLENERYLIDGKSHTLNEIATLVSLVIYSSADDIVDALEAEPMLSL